MGGHRTYNGTPDPSHFGCWTHSGPPWSSRSEDPPPTCGEPTAGTTFPPVSLPSNKQSLRTSLLYNPSFVLTTAVLTSPSPESVQLSITPNGHVPRELASEETKTTSPGLKFRLLCNHFCLDCNNGKYSLTHLFQNNAVR
ncbi:unnamed protein product [Dicrocoelium dendriticum]|nr:unnamed protein product [Dicrocoelium dendriticum]